LSRFELRYSAMLYRCFVIRSTFLGLTWPKSPDGILKNELDDAEVTRLCLVGELIALLFCILASSDAKSIVLR